MEPELLVTATTCSWVGLAAVVWFNRQARALHLDPDRAYALRHPDPEPPRAARAPEERDVGEDRWFEVDLFPPVSRTAGARFDETVALPIDAPARLAAVVRATGLRLRALPEPPDLGHRTIFHRARLHQIRDAAVQARARLAEGTYGLCRDCGRPIPLAVLTDRPWMGQCVDCELDI